MIPVELKAYATYSVLLLGVGVLAFRRVNRPGTRRSRWRGYWTLGGAVAGFHAVAAVGVVAWLRTGTFPMYGVDAYPLCGMVAGLLIGAAVGAATVSAVPRE